MSASQPDSPLADIRIGEVTHHWAQAQKIPTSYTPQIDSTNLQAKNAAFSEAALSEQLLIYLTEQQSAGRGRGLNKWSNSRPGAQLLSTWSFMIDQAPHPTVSPMMGLALYRAALSTWPFLKWNLKAPNDLYIGDKKIAGLLLETVSQGDDHRLLVGLGLNVLATPDQLATATCLVKELTPAAPLLAQDWISFLERLIFEMSFSLQLSFESMNSTSCNALLAALNEHPLLEQPYTSLDEQGNLGTKDKKISWMEL
jgi:BirA family biotin operon repressor/biotin-[acetyl-CoA-carboxylase] ligase